jgi:integrase
MTTRALTAAEVLALDRALLDRSKHRDRLFLTLALATGFRVSELLTLTFGQLLDGQGEIAKEVTISRRFLKGGRGCRSRSIKSRRIALSERARAAIATFLATQKVHPSADKFVFASRVGENRPITRCHAFALLKGLARELGLDASRLGCHSTRRTFARAVYEASQHDLVATQRLLGHSSPTTTARYLQHEDAELDRYACAFDPLSAAAVMNAEPNGQPNARAIL